MSSIDSKDNTQTPVEILGKLDFNTDITTAIPPVQAEQYQADEQAAEYEIPESELAEETLPAQEVPANQGDMPPPKKLWYERVGNFLKGLTYPISGALEVLKHHPKFFPLRKVPFTMLGAKVRNVIDNVVTTIKVATGRITPEQARKENQSNETALLGQAISAKQELPVKEAVEQTFGRIGSAIKHQVQQVVASIVPQPVREAIKIGYQKFAAPVVNAVKTAAAKAASGIRSAGKALAGFFRRR